MSGVITKCADEYWKAFLHSTEPTLRATIRKATRAALQAAKYDDGSAMEAAAVAVGAKYRLDPVCVIEAYDAMLDAILSADAVPAPGPREAAPNTPLPQ